MIKVLHIFNYFDQGGIENFVMNVYRHIDRSIIQFDFAFIENKQGYFDDEARDLGANIYFFDSNKKTIKNYSKNLRRVLKSYGPYQAVHSHCYFFSGVFLGVAKKCGVPIRIAHSHDTKKGRKETLIRNIYEKVMRAAIKRNSTHLLACSNLAGRYLFGSNAHFVTLYNGIDVNQFKYSAKHRAKTRERYLINKDAFVLLNIGRFADQKNHKFIIEVFSEVKKHIKKAFLILIGTGPLLNEIKLMVKEKGIDDSVLFLSNIKDTFNYYCAADVFVLPSKYEGMSIVSIESQATGLQTLVSKEIPQEVALTDLIQFLNIETKDTSVWVDSINKIINTKQRDSYFLRFVGSPFDINETVKTLSLIYQGSFK